MPMLTTLRIGLPVWPVHSPRADPLAKARHPVEHLVDLRDDVVAVDDQRALARHPQGDVEHGAVLGDVDVLAARTSPRAARAARARRRAPTSSAERLVGDPVLRVVEVEPGRLGGQPLAAVGVGGEEVAQVARRDLGVVALERPPALAARAGGSSMRVRTRPAAPARTPGPRSGRGARPSSREPGLAKKKVIARRSGVDTRRSRRVGARRPGAGR